MTDPTEMVLTGVFATALALFAISAWLKSFAGMGRPADPPVETGRIDDGSPYLSPGSMEAPPALPPGLPTGKVPVWFYRPVDLVGAAFVFMVFAGLIIASLRMPEKSTAALDPSVLLVNIGFQFVMAGVVAVLVIWRVGPVLWLGLRWPSWPWVFVIAPGAVLLMWVVFGGLQLSGYMKWMESLGVETVQDTVKLLQESDDPLVIGLMTFAAVIAAPVCEEIVFRGYFYPVLKKSAGVWPAAICSALVFSAAHGSLTAFLPLFLFGGLLVLIYEKTGSLWAPVSVHFCFNGATVLVQMAARHFNIPLDTP